MISRVSSYTLLLVLCSAVVLPVIPAFAQTSKEGKNSLGELLGKKKTTGSEDERILIRSDTMSLDAKTRVFTYRRNVEITRGDMFITADIVIGRYDAANQIEHITCEKNVVITRGDTLKSTSDRAEYNVKSGVIIMTEGPELNDRGNVLNADKVTIYVDEDRSEAEGHVRVKVLSGAGSVPSAISKTQNRKPSPSPTPAASESESAEQPANE